MNMPSKEALEAKEAFRQMSLSKKLEYIFAYYKLPIVLIAIALVVLCSVFIHQATKKNPVLYLGFVNVSVGGDLETHLTRRFVEAEGIDPKKNRVYTYLNLYMSDHPADENHQYSYASKLKMIAAINAEQMDLVLLNKEAYDLLSHSGYLLDLSAFLQQEAPEIYAQASAYLTENDVIQSDNSIEVELGTADTYQVETAAAINGLDVSALPAFSAAGFQEPVYLCVIANSPRTSFIIDYLAYITAQ